MPRLKVTHPDQTRTEYQFGEQVVTIGREVDNLVVIDEPAISRHHAVIELIEGEWWLRDLGSSNGTLHQGARITRTRLLDRASFEISGWKFRFSHTAAQSTPTSGAPEASPKGRGKGKKQIAAPAQPAATPPKGRAKGKKRSRDVARSLKSPRRSSDPPLAPAPDKASVPSSGGHAAADHVPEFPNQAARASVLETPPSFRWRFKLGWAYAAAAALVLGALSLVMIRSSLRRDDLPRPPSAAESSPKPSQPKPVPTFAPRPAIAMRESEPASLPPSTPGPPKSVPKPSGLPLIGPHHPTPGQADGGRKVLFAPGADHAGFQPVLSPRLDRVLHVKRTPGTREEEMWVDVCLNEEVILRRVRLSTEDQMRFSQDGSAWAVQAQDEKGGKFIALQGRTLRLKGDLLYWLGNRDFSHLATVTRHQGEDHLSIDGVWRSSYHHIRDLRLSEDGRQWAYVAVKSLPGEPGEGQSGERVVTQDGPMPICHEVLALELAPQGGRAAWVALHSDGKQEVVTAAGPLWQTAPGKGEQIQSLTLSQNGRRLAWAHVTIGSDPVFHLESGGSWTLSMAAGGAGLPPTQPPLSAPLIKTRVCFSPDGWHAVFAASGRSAVLMSEGGAISRHSIILLESLTFSPDGRRLAYVAMEPTVAAADDAAQRHHAALWLAGKRQFIEENAWVRPSAGGGRMLMAGISNLQFSPDGRHLACLRSIQRPPGEAHIRQAWIDDRLVPERHHHALALVWTSSDVLSLAAMHSLDDSIERVDHRSSSSVGN